MKQEDYNKNVFTEYTFTRKYGIDDLKSEYAFHGNSQGDESVSNDVNTYNSSGGWMSYIFKDIPLVQKEIDKEVLRRKEYNNNYIKDLKASGKYGKDYDQIFKVQSDPLYDKSNLKQSNNKSTESYRMIIMDLSKIDTNGRR